VVVSGVTVSFAGGGGAGGTSFVVGGRLLGWRGCRRGAGAAVFTGQAGGRIRGRCGRDARAVMVGVLVVLLW
jgi:hypothetical protein